ncbi:YitT family protein [Algirhabdus cladophorae]|uniref:YitT family protein n=1 Tax=Algirhabdus cladophorae TaxID=3377108 RepID=UPI003B846E44
MAQTTPLSVHHTPLEDVQGIGLGVGLCAIGVTLLTQAGLITGQTAGFAVIISYLTGLNFGLVFFVINLPFYVLAWRVLGCSFTVKSLAAVTLLSVLSAALPQGLVFDYVHPAVGAVCAGAIIGMGLLAMFRHNGSLGGFGVLALLIQSKTGFKAGYVQLIVDALLFGFAFFLLDTSLIIWSLLGAIVLNMVITFNHRTDRYIAR